MRTRLLCYFKFCTNPYQFDRAKDYYRILNVSRTSTKSSIRNAYLKLAKKYHPDINPTQHSYFTQIQQAYQVLSSQQLRKQYESFYSSQQDPQKKRQHSSSSQSSSTSGSQSTNGHDFKGQRGYRYEQAYNWKQHYEEQKNKWKQWENQWEEHAQRERERQTGRNSQRDYWGFGESDGASKYSWGKEESVFKKKFAEDLQNLKNVVFQNTQEGLMERLWKRYVKAK